METFRAVRRADGIIAISDFVRQFLLKDWGIASEKIFPINFGAPSPAADPVRPVRLPPGWTDFIFTAGSIEPYRCLEDVIRAVEHSRTNLGRPLRVAIAGSARKSMQPYELRLKAMAERAGVKNDLCWTGQLSSAEMTWCYRSCSAFVMTSRTEASPSTVLEAMACGSVCIAADNAPLPEFFAETAQYYEPGDAEMLARKVTDVLSWDAEKRARVSAGACERSRQFTWETAAGKTVDLLERFSKAH
jgi:glycosyltransferase involved in cell wall biosynthesis